MFAARKLQRHCLRTLSSLVYYNPYKNTVLLKDGLPNLISSNVMQPSVSCEDSYTSFPFLCHPFNGSSRAMSTSKGRSMRSKVERRMRKESGKTLREIRRAKKLKKKLMTDEERLIYNLKRAKKKVALLLQKLKKYELPELPSPVHDPELLTLEQLQAYKKIGFKNKNYVPVGVRGVFGGVVQNMHLHWKFHETVQVCCDNFPKEKIKEMATMLARLSGGIVINIHNVKTIIMFRGRNYRQPKNLIPINTLTKRKALFKARFEQALESQKLNIKKIEQQLRRMGVNPEDPVAMASIQRVASTFFNAIDKKEGSPYVFHGDKQSEPEPISNIELSEPPADSDQEELDRFIAEIEDAADQEWEAEEAAEKEEFGKLRYWNREDFGGRSRRSETLRNDYSDDDDDIRGVRSRKNGRNNRRPTGSDTEEDNDSEVNKWHANNVGDMSDFENDDADSDEAYDDFKRSRVERGKRDGISRSSNSAGFNRNVGTNIRKKMTVEDSESESMFSDLDNAMWESDADEKHISGVPMRDASYNYRGSSDEGDDIYAMKGSEKSKVREHESDDDDDDCETSRRVKGRHETIGGVNRNANSKRNIEANLRERMDEKDSDSDMYSIPTWESDNEEDSGASRARKYNYRSSEEEDYHLQKDEKNETKNRRMKTTKEMDENWESD